MRFRVGGEDAQRERRVAAAYDAAYVESLVGELRSEAADLRSQLVTWQVSNEREKRTRRVMSVMLVAMLTVGGVLLASSRDTLDVVQSCTTPSGACYKANRASTVDFRQQLLGVVAVQADCAMLSRGEDKAFRACVKTRTGLDASVTVPVTVPPP